jgi:hypothetical protein
MTKSIDWQKEVVVEQVLGKKSGEVATGTQNYDSVEVSADVALAEPYKTYLVDASSGIININVPDVIASDEKWYRFVLKKDGNHCRIKTVGGVQQIKSLTTVELASTYRALTIKANGVDGYEVLDDSRIYYENEIVTANLDLSNGYKSGAVYICVPPTDTEVTITIPDTTIDHIGLWCKFVLNDINIGGSVRIKTVSGENIGVSQEPTLNVNGSSLEVEDYGSGFLILQDSRPKVQLSSLTLYATEKASDIADPTYFRAPTTTSDPDFSETPVDLPIGPIVGADTYLGSYISDPGVLQGVVPETQLLGFSQIRRTIGSGTAFFYVELYKRDDLGVETLITKSNNTAPVENSNFIEFNSTAIIPDTVLEPTDRLVIKFYASRISGGNDPSFEFRTQGANPAREVLQVPASTISHDSISGVNIAALNVEKGHIGITASDDPVNVGDLVVNIPNDATLIFKYKGSDGVVRSNSLTLT